MPLATAAAAGTAGGVEAAAVPSLLQRRIAGFITHFAPVQDSDAAAEAAASEGCRGAAGSPPQLAAAAVSEQPLSPRRSSRLPLQGSSHTGPTPASSWAVAGQTQQEGDAAAADLAAANASQQLKQEQHAEQQQEEQQHQQQVKQEEFEGEQQQQPPTKVELAAQAEAEEQRRRQEESVLVEARRIRDVLSAVKVRPRPPLLAAPACPCLRRLCVLCVVYHLFYCRRTAPSCFCCLPSDSV